MYCSKCGASFKEGQAGKCPQCANNLTHSTIREPKKNRWGLKLLLAFILLALGAGLAYQNLDKEDELGDVVLNQLTALKNNRVSEAYYQYSSKDFQSNVSLEKFHQWVAKFPVLGEHETAKLGLPVVEGNKGAIKGILLNKDKSMATIESKLVKENEGWKISKLSVNQNNSSIAEVNTTAHPSNSKVADLDEKDALQGVIGEQLKSLQDDDYKKAYQLGSKDFRKITFENFEIYVQQFPIFKSFKTIDVLKKKAGLHQGNVTLLLKSDKESAEVEYYMTKDADKWEVGDFGIVQYFRNFDLQIEDMKNLLNVVEGQLHALQSNDLDNAYNDYTSTQYRKESTLDVFKKLIGEEPVLTRFQGTNLKSINLEESGVIVQVELFDVNNEVFVVEFILGLEGSQWKIWGSQVYAQSDSIGDDDNSEMVSNENQKKPDNES